MHYTQLDVWQKAIDFAVNVYAITVDLPKTEAYGLRAQMRRAAVSIPSNIAESEGRRSWRDRAHFYVQARGSLCEVETQLIICDRLQYTDRAQELFEQARRVGKLINGALRSLNDRGKRIADSDQRPAATVVAGFTSRSA